MIYPLTAILVELPNIFMMYFVHLTAFRTPKPVKPEESGQKDPYVD
jgi:hypothetical protein